MKQSPTPAAALKRLFLAVSLVAAPLAGISAAHAGEAEVKAAMEAFIGGPSVDSVARTPYGDLYEVVLSNGQLVYTDEKNSFIIDGSLIDTASRTDVTQRRLTELSAIDFSILPLKDAVKTVKGKGSRVIAVFEDPNCTYCKRLAKELEQMDDLTIYTFLYPILSEDSTVKSNNVWCAKDRAKVWNDWIVNAKTPVDADCDVTAIARNFELGQRLRVTGTPTIFLANGNRIGGYLPAAELEKALADVAGK